MTIHATDFSLLDSNGKEVKLAELWKNQPVMLVFYPGDFTPTCTKQLCSYRDNYAGFQKFGLQIVGISADAPGKHEKFSAEYSFKFPLLSDPDKKVAKALGATSKWMLGIAALSRAVVIIGKGGEILHRDVQATPLTHQKTEDLMPVLEKLKASGKL